MTTPDEVLQFWFGEPPRDEDELMVKIRRWFQGGPELDRQIVDRFGPAVHAALAGELDAWADQPRSRLALVILLDQFTRNVFRGDPQTYAGDAKAQQLTADAFDRDLDKTLSFPERLFLSMPLLHSEDLAMQRRLHPVSADFRATVPPLYATMARMQGEQSAKYTDIIGRFGRFPHRNAILGRTSTPEEEKFLQDWAEKAAPKGI